LANIKAYAETLSLTEMLDVDKQKEFCNTINAEATRLARLIDDLLSISSMEVGALSLARHETDVDRLLHEAMDKVRPQMAKKHITLHASLPEKLPKLKLDKDKIAATLVNLLGNAAKYTPEGGQVHFKVQAKQDVLQIDVEDTGFGISAEELPKVFDKFFRSSDPRVQKETGSGLGLSLVQEVIRLHGGKLGVQSELNKGTKFTVTLPLG
jgi:two-component system phosphate regulon sensor histidine kinase PhoR